ncbi:class Ib ribonucleoside-diphosphate reductase assembly flavoprotein NrdI [Paenibacillus nasutitermitis]|uniref:Protein NrdI n=1 Tax=Paenibacillus nasutitermitis TaxID=1652958 RepID=A0A917DK42_9BACL|nr:class Ib ribonucleoside-diphosphate reductase assembly flavoprotein NrdI [Paenibacillus nasutitermitis]GGD46552.1 protein NrdI [Paenibacillus nasutitermitis]
MLIAYDSRTGNVGRFIDKLAMRAVRIEDCSAIEEPFVLVTYTTGFGQVPDKVMDFLKTNYNYLVGVSASGNRNWGEGFAKSADRIAERFAVPVISKFELSGTSSDIEYFRKAVSGIALH